MRYKFLVAILIALSFANCKKDNEVKPWGWGNAQLTLNGENWEGKDYKVRLTGGKSTVVDGVPCDKEIYTVVIHKSLNDEFLREKIIITKIPFSIGLQKIGRVKDCTINDVIGARYYKIGSDGDVLLAIYQVIESEDNYINVSSFNKDNGIIEGTFQITFVNEDISKPDTLRFTNCSFKTKVL